MIEKRWKSLYEVFAEHGDSSMNVWAYNPEQALLAAHFLYQNINHDPTGETFNAFDVLSKVDEEGLLAYLRGKYSFEYHGLATRYKTLFHLREAYTEPNGVSAADTKQVHGGMFVVQEVSGMYTFKNFEGDYRLFSDNPQGDTSIRWVTSQAKVDEILAFYGWEGMPAPNIYGYPEGLIVAIKKLGT